MVQPKSIELHVFTSFSAVTMQAKEKEEGSRVLLITGLTYFWFLHSLRLLLLCLLTKFLYGTF